jgi:hypothetical protein
MIWLAYLGGFIFLTIVSYIASAAILELAKEDFKHIHLLALIIFIIIFGISEWSNKREKFFKENPELRDDF